MSKKHRLINRKSYFNSVYNRECLKEYKNYFLEDKLNDIEVFEISIIYLFEKHSYNGLEYKDVLKRLNKVDIDLIVEWLFEDLSSLEHSRIFSAILKVYTIILGKRNVEDIPDIEFKAINTLLEVAGGEIDV